MDAEMNNMVGDASKLFQSRPEAAHQKFVI
jgi:hypothetical protein